MDAGSGDRRPINCEEAAMTRFRIIDTPDGLLLRLNRVAYLGSVVYVGIVAAFCYSVYSLALLLGGSEISAWVGLGGAVLAQAPWYQDLRWALRRLPRLIIGGDWFHFDRKRDLVITNDRFVCRAAEVLEIEVLIHSRVPHAPRGLVGTAYMVGLLTPDASFTMIDDTWISASAWQLQEQLCLRLGKKAGCIELEGDENPFEQPLAAWRKEEAVDEALASAPDEG